MRGKVRTSGGKKPDNRSRNPYYDRRSGDDRRRVYVVSYFKYGNKERRSYNERRKNVERRENYVRVSEWSSIYLPPEHRYLLVR